MKLIHNIELDDESLMELAEYFDVETEFRKVFLQTKKNPYFNTVWLDFNWLRSLFTETDVRAFCTSKTELRAYKVTDHIGMYDLTDKDGVLDFYIGLPNRLDKRAKNNGFRTNLAWLFTHEYLHGVEQLAGYKDRVHSMEEQGRLKELYEEHKERAELVKKVGMLTKILELMKQLTQTKKKYLPVEKYWNYISQPYGVKNNAYSLTGHHIGVDIACPEGTPVKARVNGMVTQTGVSKVLGYYCHFAFELDGQRYTERYLHLSDIPEVGYYHKGDTLAFTGNTGFSTGAHLHVDTWMGDVQLEVINKDNWSTLTVDPHSL